MSVSFENQSSVPSEDRREERQPRAAGPGVRVDTGPSRALGAAWSPRAPSSSHPEVLSPCHGAPRTRG